MAKARRNKRKDPKITICLSEVERARLDERANELDDKPSVLARKILRRELGLSQAA